MSEGLDLDLGDISGLEEVIDREALAEVCRSFFDLFGISIRVFSQGGALLAQEEKKWLQEALDLHPELTRADLAAKLKISEAALYKKLRMYELGGR